MALKLLLADDSMTAQNMGKKILAEAGYDVVTVSNGAAAVKKIAELKPDLIILDVYMPGYTGLEVCERVKGAQETSKTPVLLTVGKMEPFKAEDGNRVRADGVIVKPFEASDLLAAVQKMASRVVVAPPPEEETPEYERTVKMSVPFAADASYAEWQANAAPHVDEEATTQPAKEKISVPEEMTAAPAMGMDFLEPAPPPHTGETVTLERRTVALDQPAAMAAAAEIPAPPEAAEFSVPTAPSFEPSQPPTPLIEPAAIAPEPIEVQPIELPGAEQKEPTEELPAMELPGAQHELETFEPAPEVEVHGMAPGLEATSAPQVGEIEHGGLEGLEPTSAHEEIPIEHHAQDPALVTDAAEMASQFTTKFGVEGAEPIHVGVASEITGLYADEQPPAAEVPVAELPQPPAEEAHAYDTPIQPIEPAKVMEAAAAAPPAPSVDDFEAMVAARLAAEAAEEAAVEEQPAIQPVPVPEPAWKAHEEELEHHEAAVSLEEEMHKARAARAPEVSVMAVAEMPPAAEAAPAPAAEVAPEPQVEAAPEAEPPRIAVSIEPELYGAQEQMVAEMQRAFADLPVEAAPAEETTEMTPEHHIATAMAAAATTSAAAAVTSAVTEGTQKLDSAQIAEIAEIVHRVTERLKLEIISEIAKEFENRRK